MSPLPDKGKYSITIYPITIYHGPQFRCDRIAAALPAATAVATFPQWLLRIIGRLVNLEE
jgi:hypothetical protein